MKTKLIHAAFLTGFLIAASVSAAAGTYDIQSHRAKPDGQTLCTEAIQNAVDRCAKDGGGTVYFPPGRWLTGTVYLANNVVATDCSAIGCAIAGLPEHPIENVTLSNISLGFEGGGTVEDTRREIPEKPESHPESTMFGTLPAYGFFCRHVKGLRLQNIRLQTSTPDHRHAIVLDDARDVVIDSLNTPLAEGAASMLKLHDTNGVVIRNGHPSGGTNDR